jgi:prefoldin subunit 5
MNQEKHRNKKRVMISISSHLYDKYKINYNFSKILDEILTDFLIHDASTDSIEIIESDKVKLKTDNGKIYIIDGMAYRNFISFIMDISRK